MKAKIMIVLSTLFICLGCATILDTIQNSIVFSKSTLYGGVELEECGTAPAAGSNKTCASHLTAKPSCTINTHAGASYIGDCSSASDMTTTPITVSRQAKSTNDGCGCVKYTCTKQNGVNVAPKFVAKNYYKSYTKYVDGSGSANCPPKKPKG